jgi:hypothetical protein
MLHFSTHSRVSLRFQAGVPRFHANCFRPAQPSARLSRCVSTLVRIQESACPKLTLVFFVLEGIDLNPLSLSLWVFAFAFVFVEGKEVGVGGGFCFCFFLKREGGVFLLLLGKQGLRDVSRLLFFF